MSGLPRSFAIFALCIPLAILLGVMLANPLDNTTMLFVSAAILLLMSPVLLTHHHPMLILSWNAYINAFFLPGQPYLWVLMSLVSFGVSILTRTLNRTQMRFLWLPSVGIPLVFLAIVTVITAQLTGGVGARALGSEVFGARRYVYLWAGIIGFFALTAKPIEPENRQFYGRWFFLPGITAFFSNIAFSLGPAFFWLFLLFPTEWVYQQAAGEASGGMIRLSGLAPASMGATAYMLVRYGLKGVLDLTHPFRVLIFALMVFAGLFSGFRSHLVFLILVLAYQFIVEGLWKTKYLPIFATACGLVLAIMIFNADRMPLSVQRALTFLPVDVDPIVKRDAQYSLEWRFDMWSVLLKEVPKYLILGKGYAINPTDLYLAEESVRRGIYSLYDPALISGDYHSGPLSILIPFGIFGVLGFVWFIIAAFRVLWRNFKYGDPAIKNINTFLLAFFLARLTFYIFIFGGFHIDLATFTGLVALSICLNKGVNKKPILEEMAPVRMRATGDERQLEPVPA